MPLLTDPPADEKAATAAELRERFAELAELVRSPLAELVAILDRTANVRTVASDRTRWFNVRVPGDRVVELVPESLDRARVTIFPAASSVWLTENPGYQLGDMDGAELGTVGVTIDTRGRVLARAEDAAGVLVHVQVEQWDAT